MQHLIAPVDKTDRTVQLLDISETAEVRTETIEGLQSALGVQSSREIVERAAYELSDRLSRLELALFNGNLLETAKIAGSLVAVSEQIGLETFASVARDLVYTIECNDFVAVAAISQRLSRHGEQALYKVVNYADNPA